MMPDYDGEGVAGVPDTARVTNLKGGGKPSKRRGQRLLSPFIAALKLLASQKSGGGHGYPTPTPGGAGPAGSS